MTKSKEILNRILQEEDMGERKKQIEEYQYWLQQETQEYITKKNNIREAIRMGLFETIDFVYTEKF